MDKLTKKEMKYLEDIALRVRCNILTMVKEAGVGHIGGSFSVTDILVALYFNTLNIKPDNPGWEDRDRLILSKGHGATALYSALAFRGYFPEDRLKTFGCINSNLQVHPDRKKVPGVEVSTGALGQGLSVGIGMALAAKFKNKNYYTFVIIGDGEMQEGQVWEAAMFASHYKLNNITVILDYNNVQLMGNVSDIMEVSPVFEKWVSFGWSIKEIDGHNFSQIIDALGWAKGYMNGPTIIIAHTVKGKGVSFMQNNYNWHGGIPTEEEYIRALKELNG